jgi:hypothetical protein
MASVAADVGDQAFPITGGGGGFVRVGQVRSLQEAARGDIGRKR